MAELGEAASSRTSAEIQTALIPHVREPYQRVGLQPVYRQKLGSVRTLLVPPCGYPPNVSAVTSNGR